MKNNNERQREQKPNCKCMSPKRSYVIGKHNGNLIISPAFFYRNYNSKSAQIVELIYIR